MFAGSVRAADWVGVLVLAGDVCFLHVYRGVGEETLRSFGGGGLRTYKGVHVVREAVVLPELVRR